MAVGTHATVARRLGVRSDTSIGMLASILICLLAFPTPALAGDVLVVTAVPVEVELNGLPVVRTDAAGEVTLRDVEGGEREFVVNRGDRREPISVTVPELGQVRLDIGRESTTTDSPGQARRPDAGPPVVAVVAAAGQRFSLLVDGERVGIATPHAPLVLDALAVGDHTVQVRSEDNLTIWARGVIQLQPGDRIELACEEGRMVRPSGREGVWRHR